MMEETGWKHYLRLILNIVIPLTGWLLICLLGPKLLKFFMPFVIGWVIAMIANPLVRFLERRVKLVRRHSSIVIVAAALALVIGLLYLLVSRTFVLLRQFIIDLPGLYAGIEGDVARSMEQLEHLFDFMPDSIQQSWAQFGNNLGSYMGTVVERRLHLRLWRRREPWPKAFRPCWSTPWSLSCPPISLLWTGTGFWQS